MYKIATTRSGGASGWLHRRGGFCTFEERQQIGVDLLGVRRAHPVRKTRIDLQGGVFDQLGGQNCRVRYGNDLIVVAVENQRSHVDLLRVFTKICFLAHVSSTLTALTSP